MTSTVSSELAAGQELPGAGHGGVGDPGTRLLAGPQIESGAEPLAAHLQRLGPCPDVEADRARFLDTLERSGLRGRGGGNFPTAAKLSAVPAGQGPPLVVINASESEPASAKDSTLIGLRPHLVLDGARILAAAAGTRDVSVVLHRGDRSARRVLGRACFERADASVDDPNMTVVCGPDRYVAGEASAVVSLLEGGEAKPRFSRRGPTAVHGVYGRPTLIYNAETAAHVGLLARYGAEWFRRAGSAERPGSTLVTLSGAVEQPGRVVEVMAPVTVGCLLRAGGLDQPPSAVLVGGYAGVWLDGTVAWELPFSYEDLALVGVSIGCGLLAVAPSNACGLRETARLVGYLAGESAGQCGPCLFGLAELSDTLAALAVGRASPGDLRRLHRLAIGIAGRGACRHPDGVVGLAQSALRVFAPDVRRHLDGRPCGNESGAFLGIPPTETGWR